MCDITMSLNESIYNLIPPAQAVIEKPMMHRSMVRARHERAMVEREKDRERNGAERSA